MFVSFRSFVAKIFRNFFSHPFTFELLPISPLKCFRWSKIEWKEEFCLKIFASFEFCTAMNFFTFLIIDLRKFLFIIHTNPQAHVIYTNNMLLTFFRDQKIVEYKLWIKQPWNELSSKEIKIHTTPTTHNTKNLFNAEKCE